MAYCLCKKNPYYLEIHTSVCIVIDEIICLETVLNILHWRVGQWEGGGKKKVEVGR